MTGLEPSGASYTPSSTSPDYEAHLVYSVRRAPSEFNILMVSRLLNSGTRQICDVLSIELLEDVAHDSTNPDDVRAHA